MPKTARPCAADRSACECEAREKCDVEVIEPSDARAWLRGRVRKKFAAGEALFSQGDPCRGVYYLSTGTIGIRRLDPHGNSVLLHLAYPGDTIGYRAFLNGGEHKTSAEALGPCIACFLDSRTLAQILKRNPALGLRFQQRTNVELELAHDALVQNATLSNRTRLIQLLIMLARRHGRRRADGSWRIELPMTRVDLASMVGVRHETLSRIIGRLEADGVAAFSGRHVDIACLRDLSGELHGPPGEN